MHGLRGNRNRRPAVDPCGGFPSLHGRIHGEIQPAFRCGLQGRIHQVTVDVLFLMLLRVVGGQIQVADVDMECRWRCQAGIQHGVGVLFADGESHLHRAAGGNVAGIGNCHREASGTRHLHVVDRPSTAIQRTQRRGHRGIAGGLVEAGDRQGHQVMVVFAGNLPRHIRQLHRRSEQPAEPVLQLLLQCLRLRRPDVIGAGTKCGEQQQAERNKTR